VKTSATSSRLIRFGSIGALATIVHWLIAVAAIEVHSIPPLVANVLGWLSAFTVSFFGHFWFTFRGHGAPMGQSVTRFACVSVLGFAMSTGTFALLIRINPNLYGTWLMLTLLTVAAVTYLLGRRWAFRPS